MRRDRSGRVGDELQKILSSILREDVNDPRIPDLLSVMEVRMSSDLTHATVYLSMMGSEEQKKECSDAISRAAGFIKREAMKRISLRMAPEFHYVFDDSIEKGMKLMELIDKTVKKDSEAALRDDISPED